MILKFKSIHTLRNISISTILTSSISLCWNKFNALYIFECIRILSFRNRCVNIWFIIVQKTLLNTKVFVIYFRNFKIICYYIYIKKKKINRRKKNRKSWSKFIRLWILNAFGIPGLGNWWHTWTIWRVKPYSISLKWEWIWWLDWIVMIWMMRMRFTFKGIALFYFLQLQNINHRNRKFLSFLLFLTLSYSFLLFLTLSYSFLLFLWYSNWSFIGSTRGFHASVNLTIVSIKYFFSVA
jgi:hypothetical protein